MCRRIRRRRRQARQVAARAGLAEQLAPHVSPPRMRGNHRARCSSVPCAISVGPTSVTPPAPAVAGARRAPSPRCTQPPASPRRRARRTPRAIGSHPAAACTARCQSQRGRLRRVVAVSMRGGGSPPARLAISAADRESTHPHPRSPPKGRCHRRSPYWRMALSTSTDPDENNVSVLLGTRSRLRELRCRHTTWEKRRG